VRTLSVLFFLLGCGDSHDALGDAGVDDAGPRGGDAGPPGEDGGPVERCEGIFERPAGTSCRSTRLYCHERDDGACLSHTASCASGTLDHSSRPTWPTVEATCPDTGVSDVMLLGAAGLRELTSVVGSYSHAFAVDGQLLFFDGPVGACPETRVSVRFYPTAFEEAPDYVGEHVIARGGAELTTADGVVDLEGTLTLTAHEVREGFANDVEGTIRLTGEGYEITGAFVASECADLDRSGP